MAGVFDSKDHPLAAAFQQFADQSRDDFRFAHTFTAAVATHLGLGSKYVRMTFVWQSCLYITVDLCSK